MRTSGILSYAYQLSLPTELQQQVWMYLPGADLKCIRLACKETAETTSPVLFRSFILYPHTASIARLQTLATSTELGQYVRRIVYSCAFTPQLETLLPALGYESGGHVIDAT